jgi:hypothetical protein
MSGLRFNNDNNALTERHVPKRVAIVADAMKTNLQTGEASAMRSSRDADRHSGARRKARTRSPDARSMLASGFRVQRCALSRNDGEKFFSNLLKPPSLSDTHRPLR